MKKILTSLLVFGLILLNFNNSEIVLSNTGDTEIIEEAEEFTSVSKSVSNEFLAIKEYVEELEKKLENLPNTTTQNEKNELIEEYEQVKDFRESFIEHKDFLNTLSDEELQTYRYTNEQIQLIRNGNESDAILAALSAVLTDEVFIGATPKWDASTKRLSFNVKAEWSWDGLPNFQCTDKYGLAVYGDGKIFNTTYSSSSLTYSRGEAYPETYIRSGSKTYDNDNAIIHKFDMKKTGLNLDDPLCAYYALEGKMMWSAWGDYGDYTQQPQSLIVIGGYGHKYYTGEAALSVSFTGPSISFEVDDSTSLSGEAPKCSYSYNVATGESAYTGSSWGEGTNAKVCKY